MSISLSILTSFDQNDHLFILNWRSTCSLNAYHSASTHPWFEEQSWSQRIYIKEVWDQHIWRAGNGRAGQCRSCLDRSTDWFGWGLLGLYIEINILNFQASLGRSLYKCTSNLLSLVTSKLLWCKRFQLPLPSKQNKQTFKKSKKKVLQAVANRQAQPGLRTRSYCESPGFGNWVSLIDFHLFAMEVIFEDWFSFVRWRLAVVRY